MLMATMAREAWTDERLDDLSAKVADGFARMEARFDKVDQRFERMEERWDARFEKMEERSDARFEAMEERFDARFDSLQRTMIEGAVALSVGLFGMIAALIATQL
jgi:predicted nuclease with TOPRIM domain